MANQGTVDRCNTCGNTNEGTQVVWCSWHQKAHCNDCGLTDHDKGRVGPTWEEGTVVCWPGAYVRGHWKVITRR